MAENEMDARVYNIETAPRDGRKFLLVASDGSTRLAAFDQLQMAWLMLDRYDPTDTAVWLPDLLSYRAWQEQGACA